MIKVKFYGVLRIDTGIKELELDAANMEELIAALGAHSEQLGKLELRKFIIMLNGKNIMDLKKFKTKMKDGDTVSIMSPVSGG